MGNERKRRFNEHGTTNILINITVKTNNINLKKIQNIFFIKTFKENNNTKEMQIKIKRFLH